MKFLRIPSALIIICLSLASNNHLNAATFITPEFQEDPKTGFGITFRGGPFFSLVNTKDGYFGTSTFTSNIYGSGGIGLLLDFPLSDKSRLWLNPEVQTVNLKRFYSTFNLSFQVFLSRSFFILGGISGSLDNFSYGGVGPNLGLGVKMGGRSSIYLEGSIQYKNLAESELLVSYSAYRAPVSLVYRLDLSRTFRKSRISPVLTPAAPIHKPETPQPVQEQVVAPLTKKDTTVTIIPLEQKTTEPVRADTIITLTPEKPAVRRPITELTDYSYNDLVLLLDEIVKEEDFLMAEKIQDEIKRREAGLNFGEIPLKRLNELLDEAVKSENYDRAALIQEEIEKR